MAELKLSGLQIERLRVHVERRWRDGGCDHTHRFTQEWTRAEGMDWEDVLDLLEEAGWFCDCEVMNNAVGWQELTMPAKQEVAASWELPPDFSAKPEDSFSKVVVCDGKLGKNTAAEDGEWLMVPPRGTKARKRMRVSVHFFVGCPSGLPTEVGVVTASDPTTAEAFAAKIRESGLAEFANLTYHEAAFVLSRVANLPVGTPVGTHFMEMSGAVGKRAELRVHKVVFRK